VVDPVAPLDSLDIDLRDKERPITLGNFVDIERPVFDPLAMMRPAPENNAVGKRQEGQ
jgi:hypothetical protein